MGSEQVVIISEDAYYKDNNDLPFEDRAKVNYDHPDSIGHSLLLVHLKQLQTGEAIDLPIYNHANHERMKETRMVGKHTITVLEGILLFVLPELREKMDILIYMDTPLDICLIRRLKRDLKERKRTVDSVLNRYEKTVRPMYLQFIAIDMIKAKMKELLKDNHETIRK